MTTSVDMMITILHITISSGMEAAKEGTEQVPMEEREANKACMVNLTRVMVCRRKQHMIITQLHQRMWVGTGNSRTRPQLGTAPVLVLEVTDVRDPRSREKANKHTLGVLELSVVSPMSSVVPKPLIQVRIRVLPNKEEANRVAVTRLHVVTETLRRLQEDRVLLPVRQVVVLARRRIPSKVRQVCHRPKARVSMATTAINLNSILRCTGNRHHNTVLV